MAKTALEFGQINIVVNDAAHMKDFAAVVDSTEHPWDRSINVTLKGAFLTSKYAIPEMLTCLSHFLPLLSGFWEFLVHKVFAFNGRGLKSAGRPDVPFFLGREGLAFWGVHVKIHGRKKDGKEHGYFSIVESRRVWRAKVVHRTVL